MASEAVIWDSGCEAFLLAEPELRHYRPGGGGRRYFDLWLVFGPAYHADFDFYQVAFDEERSAFGLAFRGVFIGYRRGFIHAADPGGNAALIERRAKLSREPDA